MRVRVRVRDQTRHLPRRLLLVAAAAVRIEEGSYLQGRDLGLGLGLGSGLWSGSGLGLGLGSGLGSGSGLRLDVGLELGLGETSRRSPLPGRLKEPRSANAAGVAGGHVAAHGHGESRGWGHVFGTWPHGKCVQQSKTSH